MLQNIPGAGSTSRLNRTATIYASGHELTLDNVNTKLGTSIHQEDERPYISGGAFDGYEVYKDPNTGKAKSVINIINPNSETRFATIYAGDYFRSRDLDVEINLDGKLVQPVIYTGDDKHTLKGDVTVKLGRNTNVTRFDKTYHEGNLDVTLGESANRVYLSPKDIRNLTLEENSRLILAEGATFNVNNLVLKNNALIDFREMKDNNPVVNGNFEGELNTNDSRKGGSIFLNNNQTLEVKGDFTGTTKLNNGRGQNANAFLDKHVYLKTPLNSTGILSIEDTIYDNYILNSTEDTANNVKVWTTDRKEEAFGDFYWKDEDNRVIPEDGGQGLFYGNSVSTIIYI